MKISPNRQGMVIGFGNRGATIITDMNTRSNERSVPKFLVSALDSAYFSDFVDRYVKTQWSANDTKSKVQR